MRNLWRWGRTHPRLSTALAAMSLVLAIAAATSGTSEGARASLSAPTVAPVLSESARPTSTSSASAPPTTTKPAAVTATGPRTVRDGTVVAALATLRVKGRAPTTGYSRAQFGVAWTDNTADIGGHNGCDTRNDILRRDLTDVSYRRGRCLIVSGTLADPYTARTIHFVRGQTTSSAVQIDHVVALADAWQKGAQQWGSARRTALANDPLNLLAVDGPSNESKGAGDAATWLPPNKSFRCAYVARQVAVKARYDLWITRAEHDAIDRVLARCPAQTVPRETGSAPPVSAGPEIAVPTPSLSRASVQSDVSYANCTAVRAAGKAPLYRGQPGYAAHLDRDGDGVACET